MSTKLSLATLDVIAGNAAVPQYRRDSLSPGIVHFGVGNFHRAHQAVYLDDLFNTGRDHDWALIGAGVLPSDETMRAEAGKAGLADDGGRAGQRPLGRPHHGRDDRLPVSA